jgi:hypothetical protein
LTTLDNYAIFETMPEENMQKSKETFIAKTLADFAKIILAAALASEFFAIFHLIIRLLMVLVFSILIIWAFAIYPKETEL